MAREPLTLAALALALAVLAGTAPARGWLERLPIERDAAALASSDRLARRAAARRLGREGAHDVAVLALIDALPREVDPEVRVALIDAIAQRRDRRALEVLTADAPRLRDAEREARVRALAAIDAPAARAALVAELGGPAGELALERAVELGAAVVEPLVPLLVVPESVAAVRAASALGRIGDRRGVEALVAHAGAADVDTRVAILDALGRAGDERGAPVVLEAVGDPDARIASTALRAIARLGGPDAGDVVLARLDDADPALARAALEALAVIDPARAVPSLERALGGAEREAAWSVITGMPDVAFVPLLVAAAGESARRGAAADALGRIAQGGGVAALTVLAAAHDDARVALAIALRRWRDLDGSARDAALRVIARGDHDRALLLRAVARDAGATGAIRARLASDDALARALAARALITLDARDGETRDALRAAIARETDALAGELEVLAATLLELGAASLPTEWRDAPARAAAALRLLAIATPARSSRETHERRRSMLAALRDASPRLRSVAADALARAGDRRASVAIAALLDDRTPEVRVAAARALARLRAGADPRVAPALAAHLALEPDARVRRALRDVEAGVVAGEPGDACLHVRLARAESDPAPASVELVLPTGAWLVEPVLPSGELVVCGLPHGEVDVRLSP